MGKSHAVWLLFLLLQTGVAQRGLLCSVEIKEPKGSVLTGQRMWLECHLHGDWAELIGCTLNEETNMINSSLSRNTCQLSITAKRVGINSVQCTVLCIDGSTNSNTTDMTVIVGTGTSPPAPPSPTSQAVHTSSANGPQSTATLTPPTDGVLPDSDGNNSVLLTVIIPVCVGGILVVVMVVIAAFGVAFHKRNTARRKRTTP